MVKVTMIFGFIRFPFGRTGGSAIPGRRQGLVARHDVQEFLGDGHLPLAVKPGMEPGEHFFDVPLRPLHGGKAAGGLAGQGKDSAPCTDGFSPYSLPDGLILL
jgi:hypothetical protein